MMKKKSKKGQQPPLQQQPADALLASRRAVELFRKTAMLDDRLDHWGSPEGGTKGIDPKVRSGASACVVGDEVWVYGGLGAGRTSDFNILHLPTMQWRCLPVEEQGGMHPPARSGHSCTAIGHRFVIFGGEGEALVPDGGGDAHKAGHVVGKGKGRVAVHSHRNDLGDAWVFDTLARAWQPPVAMNVGRRADGTHASQQNAPSARRGHTVTFVPGSVPPRACVWGERDWHDVPHEHVAFLETGVDVHAAREERRAKHLAELQAAERAAAAAVAHGGGGGGGGRSEGAPKAHGVKDHRRASDAAELLPGSRAGGGSGSLWLFGGAGPDVQHATETTFDGLYVCDLHDFVWTKARVSGLAPPARVWHTATRVQSRIVFVGGMELTVGGVGKDTAYKRNCVFTVDTVNLCCAGLDVRVRPAADPGWLVGHTAVHNQQRRGRILIFGGREAHDPGHNCGSGELRQLVLGASLASNALKVDGDANAADCEDRWERAGTTGIAPTPRSRHLMLPVSDCQLLLFGGTLIRQQHAAAAASRAALSSAPGQHGGGGHADARVYMLQLQSAAPPDDMSKAHADDAYMDKLAHQDTGIAMPRVMTPVARRPAHSRQCVSPSTVPLPLSFGGASPSRRMPSSWPSSGSRSVSPAQRSAVRGRLRAGGAGQQMIELEAEQLMQRPTTAPATLVSRQRASRARHIGEQLHQKKNAIVDGMLETKLRAELAIMKRTFTPDEMKAYGLSEMDRGNLVNARPIAQAVETGAVVRAVGEDEGAVGRSIGSRFAQIDGNGSFRAKLAAKREKARERVQDAKVEMTQSLPASFRDFKVISPRGCVSPLPLLLLLLLQLLLHCRPGQTLTPRARPRPSPGQ
jgi:hypothetical protein